MGSIHAREVGVDKERIFGGSSSSNKGGGVVWTFMEGGINEKK